MRTFDGGPGEILEVDGNLTGSYDIWQDHSYDDCQWSATAATNSGHDLGSFVLETTGNYSTLVRLSCSETPSTLSESATLASPSASSYLWTPLMCGW